MSRGRPWHWARLSLRSAPVRLQLGCVLVAAYCSYAFYQIDESVQVLGFLATKLGIADTAGLPWEYAARMRPWLQVGVYWIVARAAALAHITSPDALTWLLRTLTGIYAFCTLRIWVRTASTWFDEATVRTRLVPAATLTGFLPYLMVRVSSETVSGATLAWAAAVLLAGVTPDGEHRGERGLGARAAFAGGVLLGVAFEVRFQSALASAGLVAWLLWRRILGGRTMGALVGGGALVVALAVFVDRWGYGTYCFPPYQYLVQNLRVSGDRFGRAPFFAYAYLLLPNIFFPVALLWLGALVTLWIKKRKHVLTWMTVPFVLVHSALGHKEERFLFPLLFVATAMFAVLWPAPRGARVFDARWFRVVIAWNVVAMALTVLYPLGWNHHMPLAAHLRRAFPERFEAYSTGWEFDETYPMYTPPMFRMHPLAELAARPACEPTYLVGAYPQPATVQGRATRLLYTEWPLAQSPWLTERAMRVASAYNAWGPPRGLQQLYWSALYELSPSETCAPGRNEP